MSKNNGSQPPIRKSFLVVGGVVAAVALLGFIAMKVLGGGEVATPPTQSGSGSGLQTSAPKPPVGSKSSPAKLREGGRDPFNAVVGPQAAAPAQPKVAPAAVTTETSRYTALVSAGKCQALPGGVARTLEEVLAHRNACLTKNP